MPYYLSYIRTKFALMGLDRHISLVLTEHNPPASPKLITRVGLVENGQVFIEDRRLSPEAGMAFEHRTYPISKAEMTLFLKKVNSDRRKRVEGWLRIKKRSGDKYTIKGSELWKKTSEIDSRPGGPGYNLLCFNCKTYALSVLREIGIIDKSLENFGIDNPAWSGQLTPFTIYDVGEKTFWDNPPSLSPRINFSDSNLTKEQITSMQFSIRCNELRLLRQDLLELLKDKTLSKIPGIEDLKKEVEEIQTCLENLDKSRKDAHRLEKSWPAKGDVEYYGGAIKQLKEKIENFEKTVDKQKYPFSTKLADALKKAINYLGASFTLSAQHKSRQVLSQYQKSVQKTHETVDQFDPAKHIKPKKPSP